MNRLNWELHTLSRAVAYKNLSSASVNIGMSQPQLSRIVARLEEELKVVLLDRASKRKSAWTQAAHDISELYKKTTRDFDRQLLQLAGHAYSDQLRVGTLEGLIPLALEFCDQIFGQTDVHELDLDVHDLNKLEELFYKGDYDLIFVSREPVAKKPRFMMSLGYQELELRDTGKNVQVMSSYEAQSGAHNLKKPTREEEPDTKVLVSNSVLVRQHWFEEYGGHGTMPSKVSKTKPSGTWEPVILLGADVFSPLLWEKIVKFKLVR